MFLYTVYIFAFFKMFNVTVVKIIVFVFFVKWLMVLRRISSKKIFYKKLLKTIMNIVTKTYFFHFENLRS